MAYGERIRRRSEVLLTDLVPSISLDVVNMAISHIGVGAQVANIETEQSQEAFAAKLFYPIARDITLRDFPWPFATFVEALGLVNEFTEDEWRFSYRYPSDTVYIRRILSGCRNDTPDTRVPYIIGMDGQGTLIYTDAENAEIEHTIRHEDPRFYPPDFSMAFSFQLAFLMAPRLTIGNSNGPRLQQTAYKSYLLMLSQAVSRGFNEQSPDRSGDGSFVTSRN